MALEADPTVITQAVHEVIDSEKASLELERVYFGRPDLLPESLLVTVETGPLERRQDATHKWAIGFTVWIVIWHEKVQSSEATELKVSQVARNVTKELHKDFKLGGRVIFGFVTREEPRFDMRTMRRATRLVWEAESREIF